MGKLNVANHSQGNFKNPGAVRLLVNYITRANGSNYRDLIGYGGAGIVEYAEPSEIIRQISYVQDLYDIRVRKGRRMYHEYFTISEEEFPRLMYQEEVLKRIARDCCNVYYNLGFQVVYAIHGSLDIKLHIHFAVSTISYIDGRKWHSFFKGVEEREAIFNQILDMYKNRIVPIERNYR